MDEDMAVLPFLQSALGVSTNGVWTTGPGKVLAHITVPTYTFTIRQRGRRTILRRAQIAELRFDWGTTELRQYGDIICAPRDVHRRRTESRAVTRRARKRAGKR